MTSLPSPVPPGELRCRVQGFVDPDTFYVLFKHHFPLYGVQARVIANLLHSLARYVTEHINPNDSILAREQQLAVVLSRVSFGQSSGRGHRDNGHEPAEAPPSGDPGTADVGSEALGSTTGGIGDDSQETLIAEEAES